MGGGASRWCRAAKKIGFPCASFSNEDSTAADPPTKTISCPAKSTPEDNDGKQTEEPEPKVVADKNLCAICLEPLSSSHGSGSGSGMKTSGEATVFTAQCTHAFHFVCIASNIRHGSVTCPICRAHWSHLPRELTTPPSCNSSDPVLRILDDSIATSRVNRRSFLRSTRYNDDDPVDPDAAAEPSYPRLHFAVISAPIPPAASLMPLRHHFQLGGTPEQQNSSSSSPPSQVQQTRAYLSVKLAHQQATDLVLVASPNGPHLRLLKQSMALVVFSLRPVDRLAIVTYSTTASRAFPLRRMSSQGKRAALQVIDRLCYLGEAEPTEGLRKGVKILDDRAHQNPLSCILHLSDSPTRSYVCSDLQFPIPVHRFHIGFGFGMSNGFVMHEFEEFLVKLLGGVIRDTQLRVGENGGWVRLGELRGGEERRIPVDLTSGECGFMTVSYSYVNEGGTEQRLTNGEIVVGIEEKCEGNDGQCEVTSITDQSTRGRSGSVERWDYLDPFMARRWAKHLHGYKA